MNLQFESADARLLARVIHLAHRFGCTYTHLEARRRDGIYASVVEFEGEIPAMTRLAKHIDKLIAMDAER